MTVTLAAAECTLLVTDARTGEPVDAAVWAQLVADEVEDALLNLMVLSEDVEEDWVSVEAAGSELRVQAKLCADCDPVDAFSDAAGMANALLQLSGTVRLRIVS